MLQLSNNMKKLLYWLSIILFIVGGILAFQYLGWIQFMGWVYSGAFALSAVPQSMKSIKEGHSRGVADGTLLLWMLGEIGGLFYGLGLMQWPIIFNCGMNAFWVGIVGYYRLYPRE